MEKAIEKGRVTEVRADVGEGPNYRAGGRGVREGDQGDEVREGGEEGGQQGRGRW